MFAFTLSLLVSMLSCQIQENLKKFSLGFIQLPCFKMYMKRGERQKVGGRKG